MSNQAIETVKAMMKASNLEDYKKVASFFAEDCVYEDVPAGKSCHGKEEVIAMGKEVHTMFPDHEWEWKSSFGDSDHVATEAVWSGTFTQGNFLGLSPTGKKTTFRTVSVTELQDGKIKRNTDYYDLLGMFQQLGIPFQPAN